jgi:hypothetical protein
VIEQPGGGIGPDAQLALPAGVVICHQLGSEVASIASTLMTDHCGQFRASARYWWTSAVGRSMVTDLVMARAGAVSVIGRLRFCSG